MKKSRALALAHGAFWVASGLWPIFHIRSFERVTGEKTDDWLVKTVGALLAAAGALLSISAVRGDVDEHVRALAVEMAAVLTTVDVVYVAQRRIPKIYLLDAALHTGLISMWLAMANDRGRRRALSS